MKKISEITLSPRAKFIFFAVALFIGLAIYVYVNNKLESGMLTSNNAEYYVDTSVCEYKELENDRISLTVPGEYAANATQPELDKTAAELGYEAMTLNENKSITYIITKQQHEEMITNLYGGIMSNFNAMIGSRDYDKITAIDCNEDITEIKVSLSSKSVDYDNSMSMIQFKLYNTLYNVFKGTPDAPLHVMYYNADNALVSEFGGTSENENIDNN